MMIVFLTGPFGGGKTSVADELIPQVPDCRLFDPEEVGFMLRSLLPGYADDFQDLPPWRTLVAATAAEVASFTGQTLIAPMSILRADYAHEIHAALDEHGMRVCHILLHADTTALHARIAGHEMFSDDPERSARVAAFRRSRVGDYEQAYREWLAREADLVIDTTDRTPQEAAVVAAQHITGAHPLS